MANRTGLFSRTQPGGVWTIDDIAEHPGDIWFVDSGATSTGADSVGHGQNPDEPFLTIDYAIGQTTASQGDVIYVLPGHAETITSVITMDMAGVSVIGLGRGRNRPALTGSGAIDVITVTAANCHIENLRLIGAAANVTALVNIAAADLSLYNMIFEPAETPLMTITVAAGGDRFHLKDFKFLGSANGPDCFVDFETGTSDDWIIENGFINCTNSGMDLGVFRANGFATSGGIIKDVIAIGLDTLFIDFNSSSAVGEGLIFNCAFQHTAAATIANGMDLGGYGTAGIFATDGPHRSAILLPGTSAT